MLIVCPGCKNQITFDDATIPTGSFKVRCTSCGKTISTQKKESSSQAPLPPSAATITDKIQPIQTPPEIISPAMKSFVNAQIASAKKEILDAIQILFRGSSIQTPGTTEIAASGSNVALVCGGDSSTVETIQMFLANLGYQVRTCMTAAESLKSADSPFGIIVIDPSFTDDLEGAKKLIVRVNAKKAVERRQLFSVLISATQKSMDGNSAFLNGVNLIINKADLANFETYIRQGQQYFQQFYSTIQAISQT